MRSIVVWPLHDPGGIVFPHIEAMALDLRSIFDRVIIGLSANTVERQPAHVGRLKVDPFFQVFEHQKPMPVGDEFRRLYAHAAASCPPEQQLHLCFPDRLAFALNSDHRDEFLADISAVQGPDVPLLFQRSESAWLSHPSNYRELESMVSHLGRLLFKRSLDFAWCHLVVTAGNLAAVLPKTNRHDLSLLAELLVWLMDEIQTQDVDWLAWEDPYICGRDPQVMKAEQESSPAEIQKRLSYVLPMMEVLAEAAGADAQGS